MDIAASVVAHAEGRRLPQLIAAWSATTDVRRSVAMALRIDLALLVARPDLAVECVVRRCPELAESWRPRMRALLPPEVPLERGVIEEYRSDAEGELLFSDDCSRIAIIGRDDAVVWDRASGVRIHDERTRRRSRAAPHWTIDRADSDWGRGVVVSADGARRWSFAHSRAERAYKLDELGDHLGLVSCEGDDPYGCGDDEPAHYLVSLATQALLWRAPGSFKSAQRVGHRIYVQGFAGDVTAHSMTTGECVGRWYLSCGDITFGHDGIVATRTESVIRIWDLARAPREPIRAVSGGAEFSPDGTRLIIGDRLFDARTGRTIARLELHGVGSWLEGGPPADCRRLCNGVFVESTPFGFYAWETETGRPLVEDRARRAEILDAVAFDPTGRVHAYWPGRHRPDAPNPLRLYSVLDGVVVFEREISLKKEDAQLRYRLGFSADGEELWWENVDGTACVLTIRTGSVRTNVTLPIEPPPARATIADGLLIVGELAIPIDTNIAITSRDGACIAGSNAHYVIGGWTCDKTS